MMTTSICNEDMLQLNQFNLRGYDIDISYSATSIAGVPLFTYSTATESRDFRDDEITIEDTALGQIVTVQLKNNAADEGLESLSLLIPVTQLEDTQSSLEIQTLAIFSQQLVFVAPGTRQLQQYKTVYLSGTAQFVIS